MIIKSLQISVIARRCSKKSVMELLSKYFRELILVKSESCSGCFRQVQSSTFKIFCSSYPQGSTQGSLLFFPTNLSRHQPLLDLLEMTGKLWIMSHRFSFRIKLCLPSAIMKIIHTTLCGIYTYFFSNECILTLKRHETWSAAFEFYTTKSKNYQTDIFNIVSIDWDCQISVRLILPKVGVDRFTTHRGKVTSDNKIIFNSY